MSKPEEKTTDKTNSGQQEMVRSRPAPLKSHCFPTARLPDGTVGITIEAESREEARRILKKKLQEPKKG